MTAESVRGKPGDPQSENLYPYVRNDPLMFTDPLGDRFSGHICQPAGGSWIPWSIVRGECVSQGLFDSFQCGGVCLNGGFTAEFAKGFDIQQGQISNAPL